ncbi:uncharacterized protein DNG_06634 [Cephalotrichum gorgonifer]|uniref:Uncharacterized protein n=1 Tax=Cephalotrichum gorgonifer TaxID=2041049 RepID=A0AAE8N017_9PEZI|nr:uncharacterized protein DNG_06634 [Cephalotrichum gorgonifer]
MTSTPEPTAPFTVRSAITSLWSNRHARLTPSAPASPSQNETTPLTTTKNGTKAAGADGARTHEPKTRPRDEEAETWGAQYAMGVGAGAVVGAKATDKEGELRRKILGKRTREDRELDRNGRGKKDGEGGDGDSDEEVGRSALGRKKRAGGVNPAPARTVGKRAGEKAEVQATTEVEGKAEIQATIEGEEVNGIEVMEVDPKKQEAEKGAEGEVEQGGSDSAPAPGVDGVPLADPNEGWAARRKRNKRKKRKAAAAAAAAEAPAE